MARKSTNPTESTPPAVTPDPEVKAPIALPGVYPTSAATEVPEELRGTPEGEVYAMLTEYRDADGLLELEVLVSHDDRIAGHLIFTPLTARVAGLVSKGFLEVPIVEEGW